MRSSAFFSLLALCGCTFGQLGPEAGGVGGGGGDAGMLSTTGEEIDAPTTGDGGGSAGVESGDADSTSTASPAPDGTTSGDDATAGDDNDEDDDDDDDEGMGVCDGDLFWSADFSVDPTTLDVNGDGIDDWVMRDGNAFPVGELAGGLWGSETGRPLDTRPLDDFASRLLVDVRMRATSMGTQAGHAQWFLTRSVGVRGVRSAVVVWA